MPAWTRLGFTFTLIVSMNAHAKEMPSHNVSFPNYRYKQSVRSIRDPDFRNMTVRFFGPAGKIEYSFALLNGLLQQEDNNFHDWVSLVGLNYFEFTNGEPSYALANYEWVSCGASCSGYGYVQLYELEADNVTVRQQISFIAKTPEAGAFFDPATRTLTVTANHYAARDAHCCPSKQDIITFRWSGYDFKKATIRTVPYVPRKDFQ